MKDEISSVDLHFLIKESQYLIGSKVEKVYESESSDALVHLHVPSKGNVFLKITDKAMFLTAQKEEMPEKPTQFAMILRKKLTNSRLRDMHQLGFERIALLTFTTKDKATDKTKLFKLVIELFGGGNIILCDDEDKILVAKKYMTFKDREIRRNAIYKFPERKILEEEEFIAALTKTERENISKSLAMDAGLGGFYSTELCARAGIKTGDKQSVKLAKVLFKEFNKFLGEKVEAIVIEKDAYPIKPESSNKENLENAKQFTTFSEAIASINQVKKAEGKNVELTKTAKIASEQQKKIDELHKKADEDKRRGELIYENYATVKEIIDEIKKAREKYSWDEIKKKLKGHKIIKDIDEKDGKIKIEL